MAHQTETESRSRPRGEEQRSQNPRRPRPHASQHQTQSRSRSQPQSQPQSQPEHSARHIPRESKAWRRAKICLTGMTMTWAIMVLAVSAAFFADPNIRQSPAAASSLYGFPIAGATLAWGFAELATFIVRARRHPKSEAARRGIHPGAHVGVHLVLWLAGVLAVILSLTLFGYRYAWDLCGLERDDDYDYEDITAYDGDAYDFDYSHCTAAATVRVLIRIIMVMWCLSTVTHFALFVAACIDTRRRNAMRRGAEVVFYTPDERAKEVPPADVDVAIPPPALSSPTPAAGSRRSAPPGARDYAPDDLGEEKSSSRQFYYA